MSDDPNLACLHRSTNSATMQLVMCLHDNIERSVQRVCRNRPWAWTGMESAHLIQRGCIRTHLSELVSHCDEFMDNGTPRK